MAKQIRTRWVYRKNNRWWRYLPRRNDSSMKFDYEGEGSLDEFTDKIDCSNPPKLWVAWLHKDFKKLPNTVITIKIKIILDLGSPIIWR